MSAKTIASLIVASEAHNISIAAITSVQALDVKLMAFECALSQDSDVAVEAIKGQKWLWVPMDPYDSGTAKIDFGCPTSMVELKAFVDEKPPRFPRAKTQDEEGYLEYYTNGAYTVETDSWSKYKGFADEIDNVASPTSKNSTFFLTLKHEGEKKAVCLKWRAAAHRARLIFAQFLKDFHVREDFLRGKFTDWAHLRRSLLMQAGVCQAVSMHKRPSELFNRVKATLAGKAPYFVKYMQLLSTVDAYLIRTVDPEKPAIEHGDIVGEYQIFTGPEVITPIFKLFVSILAAQHLTAPQFVRCEDEFIAAKVSIDPVNLASSRLKWHELLRQAVPLSKVASVHINQVAECEADDEQDEIEHQIEQVCAVWNNKFEKSNRKFSWNQRGNAAKFVKQHAPGVQRSQNSRSLMNSKGYVAKASEYCLRCMEAHPELVPHLTERCFQKHPELRSGGRGRGYNRGSRGNSRGGNRGGARGGNRGRGGFVRQVDEEAAEADDDTRSMQQAIDNCQM